MSSPNPYNNLGLLACASRTETPQEETPVISFKPETVSPSLLDEEDEEKNENNMTASASTTPSESKPLADAQKKQFMEWVAAHGDNLYPSRDEKTMLAQQLDASFMQVSRLFSNLRRRLQQQKRKQNPDEEKNGHSDKENQRHHHSQSPQHETEEKRTIPTRREVSPLLIVTSPPTNSFSRSCTPANLFDSTHTSPAISGNRRLMHTPNSSYTHPDPANTTNSEQCPLRCDEAFEPPLLEAEERCRRIDSTIHEVFTRVCHAPRPKKTPKSRLTSPLSNSLLASLTASASKPTESKANDTPKFGLLADMQPSTAKNDNSGYVTPPPSAPLPPMNSTATLSDLKTAAAVSLAGLPTSSSRNNVVPSSATIGIASLAPSAPSTTQTQSSTSLNEALDALIYPQQQPNGPAMNSALGALQNLIASGLANSSTTTKEALQQTGTSLALNQLIGNSSASSTVPSSQSSNMLFTSPLNSLPNAAALQQRSPWNLLALLQQQQQQQQQQQGQGFIHQLQQAIQLQHSQLSMTFLEIQKQQQQQHLNATNVPPAAHTPLTPDNTVIDGTDFSSSTPIEKNFQSVNESMFNDSRQSIISSHPHWMSPPLSSHTPASSSSPMLYANEDNKSERGDQFSDISSRTSTPPPRGDQCSPTLMNNVNNLSITPPSTDSSPSVKDAKKNKKEPKTEKKPKKATTTPRRKQTATNNDGTPVSRKRPLAQNNGRLPSAKKPKTATKTILPRKFRDLTENETIAVAVLAGLANGRF